jgi:hypothetical protein
MSTHIMQAGPGYEEVANLLQQASVKLLDARLYCTTRRRNTSYGSQRSTSSNLALVEAPAQLAQPSQQAPTHIAPAQTYRTQQQQQRQQPYQWESPPMVVKT